MRNIVQYNNNNEQCLCSNSRYTYQKTAFDPSAAVSIDGMYILNIFIHLNSYSIFDRRLKGFTYCN